MVLLIKLHKVVLGFESMDETLKRIKATEQYFLVVLFIILYKSTRQFEP